MDQLTPPIPVIGITVINRGDLLLRLVKSIDYPYGKMVIIHNGYGRDPEVAEAIDWITVNLHDVYVCRSVQGFGVAASWNRIVRDFPAPYHFILSNDIQFTPGDMAKLVEEAITAPSPSMVVGNQGLAFFIVTREGIERVGYFDENFYPAYFEDCDWGIRLERTGEKLTVVPGVNAIHGEAPYWGSSTIKSDAEYSKKNGITFSLNQAYFLRKWGALPPTNPQMFQHPFNDPNWPVTRWELQPRAENHVW